MKHFLVSAALFSVSLSSAADLRNPITRDEDISGLQVATKIERVDSENYRYRYTFTLPATAKGTAQNIYIQMNCPNMDEEDARAIDDGGFTRVADYSKDGRHVSVLAAVTGTSQFDAEFSQFNMLRIMLALEPGKTRQLDLLSTAKPGYLPMAVTVSPIHEEEYDYSMFDDHESISPRAPWYPDWVISGLLQGPACPGSEATPLTRPIMSGQNMPDELNGINELLQYEVKGNRNRWHAATTESSIKLRVKYGYKIDPSTFTATLNGRDIRSLFNPVAGGTQDITLPLEGARTYIELAVFPRAGTFEAQGLAEDELHDIDPFEIRRPLP